MRKTGKYQSLAGRLVQRLLGAPPVCLQREESPHPGAEVFLRVLMGRQQWKGALSILTARGQWPDLCFAESAAGLNLLIKSRW